MRKKRNLGCLIVGSWLNGLDIARSAMFSLFSALLFISSETVSGVLMSDPHPLSSSRQMISLHIITSFCFC
jgi:hypothetical protein